MRKFLAVLVIIVFICAAFFVCADVGYSLGDDLGAVMTMAPIFTTLKVPVDIPDNNLEALLHIATGITDSSPIYKEDLQALTGHLDFSGNNIENLEGIQHCRNVTSLNLNGNDLGAMVQLYDMYKLESISLDGNYYSKLPSELWYAPKLKTISIKDNPITSVPWGFDLSSVRSIDLSDCALSSFPAELSYYTLEELYLSGNHIGALQNNMLALSSLEILHVDNAGLTTLPESLYNMNSLRELSLAGNDISSLSSSINGLTTLESLNLSGNKLTELPLAITSMHVLAHLVLDDNDLAALPQQIANAPLVYLSARNNAITNFPHTLCFSTKIQTIDLMLNRITELPSNFGQSSFSYLSIPFNQLDVSEGSATRALLDTIPANVKYTPQLEAPGGLKATSTPSSVTISWDACPTGMYAAGALHVKNYTVYEGSTKLAELPPDKHSYTHPGLSPETNHDYTVTVRYWIEHVPHNVSAYRSLSAEISAVTAAAATPSPADASAVPGDTPSDVAGGAQAGEPPVQTDALTGEVIAADTQGQTADTSAAAQNGLPVWAVVLITAAAMLVLFAGALFGWRWWKSRSKSPDYTPPKDDLMGDDVPEDDTPADD